MSYDNCPKCNANWIGGPIPADIAHNYSGTHWKREIGIDGGYIGIYDGCIAYKCRDCGKYSPVSQHPFHQEVFKKFLEYLSKNENV